jgi:hypothetical protein
MSLDVARLSPTLFWDVAKESVDWDRHRVWLVERVLTRGTWDDWLLVSRELSAAKLRELEPRLKLEPRERNFLRNWIDREDAN